MRATPGGPGHDPGAWARAGLLAAGLYLLAQWGLALPPARGAEADPGWFSGERAGEILEEFARAPRPVGSPEHARVRRRLLDFARDLGLGVEVQEAERRGHPVRNVLVHVPGRETSGTLVFSAHYDTVPDSPGASDDGLGMAALLELLRVLSVRPPLRNDVLVLFSDAEELHLLGAEVFLDSDAASDVRFVTNIDALGNAGPALLLRTGLPVGPGLRVYRQASRRPVANSLFPRLMSELPLGTEFRLFRHRGLAGLDLAFAKGAHVYHRPEDVPGVVSRRSLQHLGETLVGVAETLGEVDLTAPEAPGPDPLYHDVLGRILVIRGRAAEGGLVLLVLLLGVLGLGSVLGRRGARAVLRSLPRAFLDLCLLALSTGGVVTGVMALWVRAAGERDPDLEFGLFLTATLGAVASGRRLLGPRRQTAAASLALALAVPLPAVLFLLDPVASAPVTPGVLALVLAFLAPKDALGRPVAFLAATGALVFAAPTLGLGFFASCRAGSPGASAMALAVLPLVLILDAALAPAAAVPGGPLDAPDFRGEGSSLETRNPNSG